MNVAQICIFFYFALAISIEDLRSHKIRNRKLLYFLCFEVLLTFSAGLETNIVAGFEFLGIFTSLYLASNIARKSVGIGFGDVKLVTVIACIFFDPGFKSLELFFIALWLAVVAYVLLHFLIFRKYPHRIAMAPDIFLASGLYLYAPIGLLLPQ